MTNPMDNVKALLRDRVNTGGYGADTAQAALELAEIVEAQQSEIEALKRHVHTHNDSTSFGRMTSITSQPYDPQVKTDSQEHPGECQ